MRRAILLALVGTLTACSFGGPAVNPDPNHTHADFAIWIHNRKLDFSDPRYMSGTSTDEATHDEEGEHLDPYLHLHDEKGNVIHRHKPGLTIGDFLSSLGITMDLGSGSCMRITGVDAVERSYCSDPSGSPRWRMFVNGTEGAFDPAYVFTDLDRILLSFGADDEEVQSQLKDLTDDACLYSRTCPERGDPPAESCIADPTVPCVVPE